MIASVFTVSRLHQVTGRQTDGPRRRTRPLCFPAFAPMSSRRAKPACRSCPVPVRHEIGVEEHHRVERQQAFGFCVAVDDVVAVTLADREKLVADGRIAVERLATLHGLFEFATDQLDGNANVTPTIVVRSFVVTAETIKALWRDRHDGARVRTSASITKLTFIGRSCRCWISSADGHREETELCVGRGEVRPLPP